MITWKEEQKCEQCKINQRKAFMKEVKEVCKNCKKLNRIEKDKYKKNPKKQGYSRKG